MVDTDVHCQMLLQEGMTFQGCSYCSCWLGGVRRPWFWGFFWGQVVSLQVLVGLSDPLR